MIDIDNYMEFLAWKNGRNIDKVASKIGDVKDILSIDDPSIWRTEIIRREDLDQPTSQ